jgi:hypothetical protein
MMKQRESLLGLQIKDGLLRKKNSEKQYQKDKANSVEV